MKHLALASIAVLTLLAGSAQAKPKDIWTQINESAPRSSLIEQPQDTAQRSDGGFGILEKNAP